MVAGPRSVVEGLVVPGVVPLCREGLLRLLLTSLVIAASTHPELSRGPSESQSYSTPHRYRGIHGNAAGSLGDISGDRSVARRGQNRDETVAVDLAVAVDVLEVVSVWAMQRIHTVDPCPEQT
jgi:hypothetical protein